jgi:two-component system phosphate regulon sensor histidine kinase PhoR
MKTFSPRKVAWQAAIYSTGAITIGALALAVFFLPYPENLWLILIPPVVLFLNFRIFSYLMSYYIDHKIKLIYRSIHQEKIGRPLSSMKIDMNKDVFRDVNRDVEDWARDYRREIQQLKDQAEFRREFIGNLSHELKTPITIIQGNILTLLEGAVEDVSIRNKFLEKAAENAERLEILTRDLDSITKLESGKGFLNVQSFNLSELIRDVVDNLKDKAKENHIKLEVIQPKKDITVSADRSKIDQVLTNLIVNSINYGNRENGKTTITLDSEDETVSIEIKDNGIGISKEDMPRLFERFFRVDKSRSRHAGGTGLGLSIVKHILDAHNQTISVESAPNEGSTFSFTLDKA